MNLVPNSKLKSVVTPPIAEVQEWVKGREFPPDRPLLDVSQAVPSYPPADELIDFLKQRVAVASTHLYTGILGREQLRRELARDINEQYQADIDWQDVAITAGCNQAFCLCIDALAEPGDEVILPSPYYFNHQMWLEMRGIRCLEATSANRQLLPEPAELRTKIGPRTRALVLVSPNNPTGAQYPASLLREIYDLTTQAGIALIIDETYRDFRETNDPPHELFRIEGWRENFVHLYSFSKSYALTGHRVGAIAAQPALLSQIEKIMDCAIICAPHLGQEAALFGLKSLHQWRADKCDEMRRKIAAFKSQFAESQGNWELTACGAFFAYLRHPFRLSAMAAARQLADQANVLCLPGSVFGQAQEGYLRLAFANLAADDVPELAARLHGVAT